MNNSEPIIETVGAKKDCHKIFTFCCLIGRIKKSLLVSCLKRNIQFLDRYCENYELIVFTNFDTGITHPKVMFRDYYDHGPMPYGKKKWKNLSFNKLSAYHDLYTEFEESFIWLDIDTLVVSNLDELLAMDNFFIEVGGDSNKRNTLFSNNSEHTVPRSAYIQGDVWKLSPILHEQVVSCFESLKDKNLLPRFDLQDIFNYLFYYEHKGNLDELGVNVLGRNALQNTVNGLGIWDASGDTHATVDGLRNITKEGNRFVSNHVPDKNILFLSMTYRSFERVVNDPEFRVLFLDEEIVDSPSGVHKYLQMFHNKIRNLL